ncbi:MAG: serine/threonine-protein kinase [Gemmatimonadales bacterium]|nr:serine/threonine-protein kinase [Gemmatimonadales bacterium]
METDALREALERAVGDQYEVSRLLGRGGMGAVFLARDRALERTVAIKVLPPGTAATAEAIERFRREARTAARLQHPGIVPLHAFGESRGLLWFAMGYVRGESLAARLERDGRLDPERARALLAQVADALDHAHRQGVVHRDLKPDNVLLDDDTGRAHLTDFGVARTDAVSASLTQVGMVMGTPAYMAPEQAAGDHAIDGRADLYALGVMGFQMLAGRLPFAGPGAREFLMQHISVAPPALGDVAPGVPEDLATIVARCLEKEPARRWPDARVLRDTLARGATDSAALSYELTEVSGYTGWTLASLALLCVMVPLAWWRGQRLFGLEPGALAGLAAVWPLALTPYLFSVRKQGYTWRSILRALCLEPAWWPFWWPVAFRRASPLRERLSDDVKRMRAAYRWIWVALAVEVLLLTAMPATISQQVVFDVPPVHAGFDQRWLASLHPFGFLLLMIAFLAWFAFVYVRVYRLGKAIERRTGLPHMDTLRLGYKPLDSPFWQDARIAALLVSDADRALQRVPQTPAEAVEVIAALARALPTGASAAAREAERAARRLLETVGQVERQVEKLGQGAQLLEGQPQLVAQVTARQAELGRERDALAAQLTALWQATVALRLDSAAAPDTRAVATATERVRALVGTIDEVIDQRPSGATMSVALRADG